MSNPGAPLRAVELVTQSFRILRVNWRAWLVALAIPSIIDVLVQAAFVQKVETLKQRSADTDTVLESLSGEENLLRLLAMLLVNVIALTLFAVSWHRLTLLGEKPRILPRVGSEHMRFATLSLVLIFVTTLITLSGVGIAASGAVGIAALLAVIAVVVVYLRLSMMFPAAAIDAPSSMAASWAMTKGSALTLFWAVVLGTIPMILISLIVLSLAGIVISAIFQGAALGGWLYLGVNAILSYLSWGVVVGIVSLAYLQLNGPVHGAGRQGAGHQGAGHGA